MKYPKEMILTLRGNRKLTIYLNDVIYIPDKYLFQAMIQISDTLVSCEKSNKSLVEFVTEEKEF